MQNGKGTNNEILNNIYDSANNALRVDVQGAATEEWVSANFDNARELVLSQALYLDKPFYESESKIGEITDGTVLPPVQEMDESWVRTTSTNFSFPHGTVYHNGYAYVATRQMPARIAKINVEDFTDVTIVTFPGTTSASLYSWSEDLIYSAHTNKLYIPFSDPDYDNRDLHIVEIDPDTLAYTTVVSESGVPGGFPKGLAVDEFLYISTTAGTQSLLKYNLDTFTLVNTTVSPIEAGSISSSIVYDNDYIYITEVGGANAKLRRYDRVTDAFDAEIALPTNAMASNVTLVGDFVYVTTLTELDSGVNGVYRVTKDLTSYDTLFTEGVIDSWGVQYADGYVWNISREAPSRLTRYNPATMEANSVVLDDGMNKLNKMSTDGKSMYFTTYESPSKLVKIAVPGLFDATMFLGKDNDVLLKISDVDKRVDILNLKLENGIATDGITANALLTDTNYLATQGAIKTYVDNKVLSGVTASNGLIEVGADIQLGGPLTGNTTIDTGANYLWFGKTTSNATQVFVDGTYVYLSTNNDTNYITMGQSAIELVSDTVSFELTPTSNLIRVNGPNVGFEGMVYSQDFSGNFTTHSVVDKNFVETKLNSWLTGTLTADTSVDIATNYLYMATTAGGFVYVHNAGIEFGRADDQIVFSTTGIMITDDTNYTGLIYNGDYSANFTPRSLIDNEYMLAGRKNISTKTANYTLLATDNVVRMDATTNPVQILLPQITAALDGKIYTLKTKDITNTCTVSTNVADSFEDGTTTYTITMINEVIQVIADLESNDWVRIN